MADVLIAIIATNTSPGSVAQVPVDDMILTLSIPANAFNDVLAIIPRESIVEQGKLLFRLKLKAHIVRRSDNQAVTGRSLRLKSNRSNDRVRVDGQTNHSGDVFVLLETREQGDFQLSCDDSGIALTPYQVRIGAAWYEAGFSVSQYHVCSEDDFDGALVSAYGLSEQHRADFLFGARGVAMQGTGRTSNGQFVRFNGGGGGWRRNTSGSPVELNAGSTARFTNTDAVHGRYEVLHADQSAAIDPAIIPPRATIYIESQDGARVLGNRGAHDTGGAIHGTHIDNYSGEGAAVVTAWRLAGGNLENAKVKFLRY